MAVFFDSASNDMAVYTADHSILRNMASFTMMAWINPTGWGENSYGRIIQKGIGGFGWLFMVDNNASIETISFIRQRMFTNTDVRGEDNAISLNTWQHVAVTHQASSTVLYVDGVAIANDSYTAGSGDNASDQFDPFYVANEDGGGRGFKGSIEDVRCYNRYMSAAEIGKIFISRGGDGIWLGRQLHWPLKEKAPGVSLGTGDVVDISYNRLDGSSLYTSTVAAKGIIGAGR